MKLTAKNVTKAPEIKLFVSGNTDDKKNMGKYFVGFHFCRNTVGQNEKKIAKFHKKWIWKWSIGI